MNDIFFQWNSHATTGVGRKSKRLMRGISDLMKGDLGSASKYDNALLSSAPDSQCYIGALNSTKRSPWECFA